MQCFKAAEASVCPWLGWMQGSVVWNPHIWVELREQTGLAGWDVSCICNISHRYIPIAEIPLGWGQGCSSTSWHRGCPAIPKGFQVLASELELSHWQSRNVSFGISSVGGAEGWESKASNGINYFIGGSAGWKNSSGNSIQQNFIGLWFIFLE